MADVQLTFGRYKGSYISQLPSFYIYFLINNAYEPHVIKAADQEWKHRTRTNSHWLMPKKKRFS